MVFRQLLRVADSFIVLSIHRVARGLRASFLYKCPASCRGSPSQHGFVVKYMTLRSVVLV